MSRYLLLLVIAFAGAHAALTRRSRPLPTLAFIAAGAAASVLAGFVAVAPSLASGIARAPLTAVSWTLLLGIGFFAAGGVLALAWLAAVRGGGIVLARWWRTRRRATPPRPHGRSRGGP